MSPVVLSSEGPHHLLDDLEWHPFRDEQADGSVT